MPSLRIVPHLWYVSEAVEAARFYTSIFPDSHVDRVTPLPGDSPSGPAGSVQMVEFTLVGQPFAAISAGPLDPFNHAVSFMVVCSDQQEIDRYWAALGEGGTWERCGWVRDRWGLFWQVAPAALGDLLAAPDREAAARVAQAMLAMEKLDLPALERAARG